MLARWRLRPRARPSPAGKVKAVTNGTSEAAGSRRKAAPSGKSTPKTKPTAQTAETKTSLVLKKLQSPKSVTIEALMEATGWQAHSVRGFLSAVVRKKIGLNLLSETGKDGVRRYRIDGSGKAG